MGNGSPACDHRPVSYTHLDVYKRQDMTYVEPDKLDDKGCNGAPDWIVEVVSYSFGMQENFMQYSFNETIPVGIYPGFEIRIADLLK